jgi:hypothetical protein
LPLPKELPNPIAEPNYVDSNSCINSKVRTPIDGTQKADFEVFSVAIKSDHFQNDAKPYSKRIDEFIE